MTKRKKIVFALLIILFLYTGYTISISNYWYKFKYPEKKYPQLYIIPQKGFILSSDYQPNNSQTNIFLRLNFKTPWTLIEERGSEGDTSGVKNYIFENNKKILAGIFYESRLYSSQYENDANMRKKFQFIEEYYNEKNLKSNYDYYSLLFSTKPSDLKIFSDSRKKVVIPYLNTLKGFEILSNNDQNIYQINNEVFKGFYMPNYEQNNAKIIFFNNNDDSVEYMLSIQGATENEILFIINSITFSG